MICCSLCGEVLTAPVFIAGKPYGWSCASKLYPNKKRPSKSVWVKAESFTMNELSPGTFECIAVYNQKRYKTVFLLSRQNGVEFLHSSDMNYDGESVYIDAKRFKSLMERG